MQSLSNNMHTQILNFWIVSALALASFAMPAHGANIMLRDRATHQGAVVYLGDVADISATHEAELQDLLTTPLLAAPPRGTQQFLAATQVRDLLASRGIDVSSLSISGFKMIEIGTAAEVTNPLAIEPLPVPTPVESQQAVIAAIEQHLSATTGHEDWQVEVELNSAELRELTKLGLELEAAAGRTPWTGMQRFQLTAAGARVTVPVMAHVDRLRHVIVALRKIDQGNLIGAADVEIRLQAGHVPAGSASSLEEVIGKEALRAIDADAVLQNTQLRPPLQVERGETVKVFARTAGITVSTFAVVQQDGSLGDLVQAQTLDKKDRFAARVSGWKQLEVLPTGATAADFATLNQGQTLQR